MGHHQVPTMTEEMEAQTWSLGFPWPDLTHLSHNLSRRESPYLKKKKKTLTLTPTTFKPRNEVIQGNSEFANSGVACVLG